MSMTKYGVAQQAASKLTHTNVNAVAAQYLAWINSKPIESAALDALQGAADVSKNPARVLAVADTLYQTMDDYPSDPVVEASLPARLSTSALATTFAPFNVQDANLPSRLSQASISATFAGKVDAIKPTIVHPQGLARWAKARGKALFSQVRVLVEGDSVTVGANANNATTSAAADQLLWAQRGYAGQLRRLMAATYGDVGEGWVTFGSDEGRWAYTGTTSASPAGPVGTGRQINAGGTAAASSFGSSFTTFDAVVYHSSGLSAPRVLVDGTDKTPTLLTATQAAFNVAAADWSNRGNTTLTHATDTGEDILQIAAAAAGNMSANTASGTSARPCSPGQVLMVTGELRSAAASRNWRIGAIFYDSAGNSLTEITSTNVASTVGSWQNVSTLITAPANTAYAQAIIRIDAAGAAAEEHDLRRFRHIPVTSVAGQGGVTYYRFTLNGLTDADHAVTIQTGATGNLFMGGIILRRSTTSGVVVHRVGKSGTTTADHAGTGYSASTQANMFTATYKMSVPDLAVICLGANDIPNQLSNGITPAVYKANLQTLIDQVTGGGGCVLLVSGPRYSTEVSGGSTQATYYQQMADLANANTHVAYADVAGELWKDRATTEALGFQNNSLYGIHPTLEGHGDLARALHSVLTRSVPIA